ALLNYLDRLTITTMRDPLKADIAMTDAQFGLLTSAFLWIYGLCSPLGGFLADRFSRRWVIVVSLFIWSAVTWLTGQMETFGGLLAARALMGVSEACYIPAALALIADYHRGPTRSLATGLHMSGAYAGAALGGVGGIIAELHGWRFGFYLFGATGVVYSLVVLALLRDAAPIPAPLETSAIKTDVTPRPSLRVAMSALFREPAFLLLLAVNALVGTANWGVYGWLPTYLREHFNLGLGEAGITATGYIQIASFIGVLIGGVWADRWSRTQPRARAWVPAIGYCVVAPCLFLSVSTSLLPLAVAGLIVFGLGRGFFDANHMPILRSFSDERFSATGYGILNFVSCVTGGILIYVGGWLKDAQVDLSRVFQFSAVGLFAVGLMLFAMRRRV
ncbi:MAG TPA: MFS transporter, partial [Opitutus sp.]|nr:MFS transporter [Opitutus sp.]